MCFLICFQVAIEWLRVVREHEAGWLCYCCICRCCCFYYFASRNSCCCLLLFFITKADTTFFYNEHTWNEYYRSCSRIKSSFSYSIIDRTTSQLYCYTCFRLLQQLPTTNIAILANISSNKQAKQNRRQPATYITPQTIKWMDPQQPLAFSSMRGS